MAFPRFYPISELNINEYNKMPPLLKSNTDDKKKIFNTKFWQDPQIYIHNEESIAPLRRQDGSADEHDSKDSVWVIEEVVIKSYVQGYWIQDSKRIGLERLKKALGFSWISW